MQVLMVLRMAPSCWVHVDRLRSCRWEESFVVRQCATVRDSSDCKRAGDSKSTKRIDTLQRHETPLAVSSRASCWQRLSGTPGTEKLKWVAYRNTNAIGKVMWPDQDQDISGY